MGVVSGPGNFSWEVGSYQLHLESWTCNIQGFLQDILRGEGTVADPWSFLKFLETSQTGSNNH